MKTRNSLILVFTLVLAACVTGPLCSTFALDAIIASLG